jgi:hypothetical protein
MTVRRISRIDEIRKKISERNYRLTLHARARMFERHISTRDLVTLINSGDIIEEYPDNEPCPAVLILGFVTGRPCHAVVAHCEDHLRIITVYWPDEEKWINYSLRKSE